ncbi:MAG TPA: hypothetical protein VFL45_08865 [Gammaproteobacteria bacterium]|nr:hypothetical protein [Gammaproteobacteria bacterium]
MIDWDGPADGGTFHSEDLETFDLQDEDLDASDFEAPAPAALPASRQEVLDRVHDEILRHWRQGDLLFEVFELDAAGANRATPADALAALWDVAANGDMPAPIAGCSLAWLMREGIWHEDVQQFLDAIYYAVTDAGFGDPGLDADSAVELVRDYADALFEDAEPDEVWLFGLDPGFSCWFAGAGCDMGWLFINLRESRCGLLLATDTD